MVCVRIDNRKQIFDSAEITGTADKITENGKKPTILSAMPELHHEPSENLI